MTVTHAANNGGADSAREGVRETETESEREERVQESESMRETQEGARVRDSE